MNAQMLFIVCFSASFAGVGIALATCAGLMLILKRQQQTSVLARLTFRPSELASKSNTTDSVQR